MKILFLNHNFVEQGTYFRCLKFASYFAEQGNDVTMITSSKRWFRTKSYQIGKVKIIETQSYSLIIGKDEGWSPLGLIHRLWHVLTNKYDVVYGFSHKPVDFIPAYFLKKIKNTFYITDWCDWYGKGGIFELAKEGRRKDPNISKFQNYVIGLYHKIEGFLEEFVPQKADLVTVICRALYDRSLNIGIKKDKLMLLISGSDTDSIYPIDKNQARANLKLNTFLKENFVLIGYCGNYHFDENLLLETFSKVCRKQNNVKLMVMGAQFSIDDKQMSDWGLSIYHVDRENPFSEKNNIIHFGRRPFKEINDLLNSSDFLVLPMTDVIFNKGRWPHKIGDYLASGKPVVVNNVGDIPDLFKEKEIGYLAAPNSDDFADKIIQMIDDKNRWEEFGRNARQVAETTLKWDNIGKIIYDRIVQK